MNGVSSTRERNSYKFWSENLKGTDLGVDGRIILERILDE